MALEFLTGLDQAEALAGVDAQRLEHRGRQHLAHAALQRQPPIAHPRPRRAARPLGAEVEQAAVGVVQLREQEATAVAEVGVVVLELVAVIAQRQRRLEAAGNRHEAAEMLEPLRVRERVESDGGGGALVAIAQRQLRELRRLHRIEELATESGMGFRGTRGHHPAQRLNTPTSSTCADQANWSTGVTFSSR